MSFDVCFQFSFELAHRLDSAFSAACVNTIHGHSYKVDVFVTSERLNSDGMVVDFGLLKEMCESLRSVYDHAVILSKRSVLKALKSNVRCSLARPTKKQMAEAHRLFGQKLLISTFNPTAEQMAKAFHDSLSNRLHELRLWNNPILSVVRVHETEHGFAQYSG